MISYERGILGLWIRKLWDRAPTESQLILSLTPYDSCYSQLTACLQWEHVRSCFARTVPMPELPTGTVTFLFTDIEGSTQLLQRLGARYGDVLAEYRALLRAVFQAHGGQEVDTQGDSFFVAFPRAVDAVQAAVAIQRALTTHRWPEGLIPAT